VSNAGLSRPVHTPDMANGVQAAEVALVAVAVAVAVAAVVLTVVVVLV
jgi:hypothetical protein